MHLLRHQLHVPSMLIVNCSPRLGQTTTSAGSPHVSSKTRTHFHCRIRVKDRIWGSSIRSVALAVALISTLVGCVYSSHPQYPSIWGELVNGYAGSCPPVAGTYENVGEVHGSTGTGTLSWLLYDIRSDVTVTHVQIVQPDKDTMEITVWNDNHVVKSVNYKKEAGFICADDEAVLLPQRDVLKSNNFGLNCRGISLGKAKSGQLVVKYRESSIGVIGGILPAASEAYSWRRFNERKIERTEGR